jgi:hypothetical protein
LKAVGLLDQELLDSLLDLSSVVLISVPIIRVEESLIDEHSKLVCKIELFHFLNEEHERVVGLYHEVVSLVTQFVVGIRLIREEAAG